MVYSKIVVLFVLLCLFFAASYVLAAESDVIAIRVINNPKHLAASDWYHAQGFSGSPQSMQVDGYDAVRDGNTVYVEASNITTQNTPGYFVAGDAFYTNIFVITYNIGADQQTATIFNQILKYWKFNTNLTVDGSCSGLPDKFNNKSCEGTVGCWRFENNFKDESGNSYDGTLIGNVSFQEGKMGLAMSVSANNTDSYVKVASQPGLVLQNEFTISADIYPINNGSEALWGGIIVNKENEYEVARGADGSIIVAIENPALNSTVGWRWINTGYIAPLNKWTNITIAYGRNALRAYADGRLVRTFFFAGSNNITSGVGDFSIASRQTGGQYFQGKLDNVKIYNHLLNPVCSIDSDCAGTDFCQSPKASIVRDLKRLSDLDNMNNALSSYRQGHGGFCPLFNAGSFVQNRTISTWPSWQNLLGMTLGYKLPLDPINQFGVCVPNNSDENARYDINTCFDSKRYKFSVVTAADDPRTNVPVNSLVYAYGANKSGTQCGFYITTENGLVCNNLTGRCVSGSSFTPTYANNDGGELAANILTPPTIECDALNGFDGKPLDGQNGTTNIFTVIARAHGAKIISKPTVNPVSLLGWTGGPLVVTPSSQSDSTHVSMKYYLYASNIADISNYNIDVMAHDSYGNVATKTCTVKVHGYCGDGVLSADLNEQCDDHNNTNGDGCDSDCKQELNYTCTGSPSVCVGDTRPLACSAKPPLFTDWNDADSVSQTWNGTSWQPVYAPSTVYNPVVGGCHYKCATGYDWDGSLCRQKINCADKPAFSVWNSPDFVFQSWDGAAWQPASQPLAIYNTTAGVCTYQCQNGYFWNNLACQQKLSCAGKPIFSDWNNPDYIFQSWDGAAWQPIIPPTAVHNETSGICTYRCQAGTFWDGTSACRQKLSCVGKPLFSDWNLPDYIFQTWNASTSVWQPATPPPAVHNEGGGVCSYKCQSGYVWNVTLNACAKTVTVYGVGSVIVPDGVFGMILTGTGGSGGNNYDPGRPYIADIPYIAPTYGPYYWAYPQSGPYLGAVSALIGSTDDLYYASHQSGFAPSSAPTIDGQLVIVDSYPLIGPNTNPPVVANMYYHYQSYYYGTRNMTSPGQAFVAGQSYIAPSGGPYAGVNSTANINGINYTFLAGFGGVPGVAATHNIVLPGGVKALNYNVGPGGSLTYTF